MSYISNATAQPIIWNQFFNLAAAIALVALSAVIADRVVFTVRYREKKGQLEYTPPKRLQ